MGRDLCYKIFHSVDDLPNWDDSTYGYSDVDFCVGRYNYELVGGNFTIADLKNVSLDLATRLVTEEDFSTSHDIVEALKVYITIMLEMNETAIVRIVYE